MFRSSIGFASRTLTTIRIRPFHQSSISRKSVTEKVSEVAEDVNLKVGKGLASAIDKGEKATNVAKEKLGAAADNTKKDVENKSHKAEQQAHQAASGARKAKQEFENELRK